MITHTLTSDLAIGLELGRRLAMASRRPRQPSRLRLMWQRLFAPPPIKRSPIDARLRRLDAPGRAGK